MQTATSPEIITRTPSLTSEVLSTQIEGNSITILEWLRWAIYISIVLYIIYACLNRNKKKRRKMNEIEKIKYRYVKTNSEVMKEYGEKEKRDMKQLIRNTISNLNIVVEDSVKEVKMRGSGKRVSFAQELEETWVFGEREEESKGEGEKSLEDEMLLLSQN